jgi:ABC-type transporter Mla subunit MlaD
MPAPNHWKLGLFVASAAVLGVAALIWLGAGMIGRGSIDTVTYFDESVQGLDLGSPVKFRGVPIGTVSEISIAPDHRHVEVHARIFTDELQRLGLSGPQPSPPQPWLDPARRSPEMGVQLASAGITGVKFLQVDFFNPSTDPPPPVLPFDVPPNYVPSRPSTLKTLEAALGDLTVELPGLLMRAGQALETTGHTLDSVRMALEPLVAPGGPVVSTLEEFRRTAVALRGGIESADLAATTASARRATDAVARAADAIGGAAGSVRGVAQSVGGLTVDASAVAEDLQLSLEQLGESLESFQALVEYLERNPAALLRGRGEPAPPRTGAAQ